MRVQTDAAKPITNQPVVNNYVFIDLTPEDRNAILIYVMGRLESGQMRTGMPARPWWMGQGLINSR